MRKFAQQSAQKSSSPRLFRLAAVRPHHIVVKVYTPVEVHALNPQSQALTPRVQALTPQVQALKSQVQALTPQVQALTPQVQALTPRVQALTPQVEAPAQRQARTPTHFF